MPLIIKELYKKNAIKTDSKIVLSYGIPILEHDLITGIIKINNNAKNPTRLNYSGMTAMKLINHHFRTMNIAVIAKYEVGCLSPGYAIIPGEYEYSEQDHWFVLTPKESNARSFTNQTNT